MGGRIPVLDVVFFIAFTTTLTTGLTTASWLSWPLVFWAVYHRWTLSKGNEKVRKEWVNWFEISKLLGAVAGLASIFWYQYKREYSETSHGVVAAILSMNIAQAVLSDLQHGWRSYPNALAGVFLILAIPRHALDVERLSQLAASTGLFILPVSYSWSALYTTWNCAFSYSGNFSWSTRVIMVAPWLVAWHLDEPGVWIGARCICLCLNMILRSTETTAFYTPGQTVLTQARNTLQYDPSVLLLWNMSNAIFGFLFWWHSM
tara:strand:+ start:3000 stop:3782 length:783 start_codon:yes stop_codon:yes gene_type:complete